MKYTLSLHLKSHGFILIPIPNESLDYFLSKGQKTIICLSNSVRSVVKIQKLKKKFFKYALLNKKINLIEFTYSLNRDSIWGQLRNYHSYSLPISYIKLSEQVTKSYHEFLKINSKWPGGRRSKLSIKKFNLKGL